MQSKNRTPRDDSSDYEGTWLMKWFYPVAPSILALGLHCFCGIGWTVSVLLSFVAWPLLGTLITIDDDLPGGWSNPDGTTRPHWLEAPFWGQVCLGLGLTLLVAAFEWDGPPAPTLAVGFFMATVGLLLLGREPKER
jgi:hypothetical protein